MVRREATTGTHLPYGQVSDKVANMATNLHPEDARAQLAALARDRAQMASRLPVPWGLMAAVGLAMAWFVGGAAQTNPGASYHPADTYLFPLITLLIVGHLVQRETGVRFRRMGIAGGVVGAGLLVWTLLMFSVALALVSTGHSWFVLIPSLLAGAVGTWGAGLVFRACVKTVARG